MLDFLGDLRRTHTCGALRASDAGKKAVLMGWVNRRRDLGQIIFVDLRDRSGVTQVVVSKEASAAIHEKAEQLRNEYVIAAIGTVKLRDANTINKNIPSGEVELVVEDLRTETRFAASPLLHDHGVVSGMSQILHGPFVKVYALLLLATAMLYLRLSPRAEADWSRHSGENIPRPRTAISSRPRLWRRCVSPLSVTAPAH